MFQIGQHATQSIDWILQVQKDNPSHNGVQAFIKMKFTDIADSEGNIGEPFFAGSLPRNFNDVCISIDTNDLTDRPNDICRQQSYIASSCSNIEDSHSRCNSGVGEHVASESLRQIGLPHQPLRLVGGPA